MSIYKRGNFYWIKITTPNGEEIRRSTGTDKKALAQEYHDQLKAEFWRVNKLGDKPRRTWPEAVERWICETSDKKSHDKDLYLLRCLHPFLGHLMLDEINRDVIDKVKLARLKQNLSKSSVNRTLAVIRAILNRSKDEWEWIDSIPKIRLFKEPKGRTRWITKEEFLRLLEELPQHQREIVIFAIATGLRQQNVIALEWQQIDLERKTMWVKAENFKTNKSHGVPLNGDAMTVLESQKGKHPQRVFTFRGEPIKWANTRAWRNALKRADITDFRWHDLRHTWASWHVQSGTPVSILQELGGWETQAMVARYAHLSTQHLMHFVDNIKI